jgi:hypothetical protein
MKSNGKDGWVLEYILITQYRPGATELLEGRLLISLTAEKEEKSRAFS